MALANTAWADYPIGGRASRSAAARRTWFGAAVAGLLLAFCAAEALPLLNALKLSGHAAPAASSAKRPVPRAVAAIDASRLLFERKAESFLRDSLRLTQQCQMGCPRLASEIVEAEKIGRFSRSGLVTGLPLGQRFAPPIVVASAPTPDRTILQVAATVTPPVAAPAPVPVPISPSLAAPLPPPTATIADVAAPLPAPRLDRAANSAPTLPAVPATDEPKAQLAPPPAARVASVPIPPVGRNDGTAVYDISGATVYLPNGERLEAHSGLGYMVDNPRYVDRRDTGPTPPATYNLVGLEGRFHGVEALRMVPTDGSKMYGRDGFLTHTYMLIGRPAQSNGCVVFKDYARFLAAFKRGYVKRLVVVPSLANAPMRLASAGQ